MKITRCLSIPARLTRDLKVCSLPSESKTGREYALAKSFAEGMSSSTGASLAFEDSSPQPHSAASSPSGVDARVAVPFISLSNAPFVGSFDVRGTVLDALDPEALISSMTLFEDAIANCLATELQEESRRNLRKEWHGTVRWRDSKLLLTVGVMNRGARVVGRIGVRVKCKG